VAVLWICRGGEGGGCPSKGPLWRSVGNGLVKTIEAGRQNVKSGIQCLEQGRLVPGTAAVVSGSDSGVVQRVW
ncbi:hypothetical protein O3P69_017736, partial [Scylla paramamosain]